MFRGTSVSLVEKIKEPRKNPFQKKRKTQRTSTTIVGVSDGHRCQHYALPPIPPAPPRQSAAICFLIRRKGEAVRRILFFNPPQRRGRRKLATEYRTSKPGEFPNQTETKSKNKKKGAATRSRRCCRHRIQTEPSCFCLPPVNADVMKNERAVATAGWLIPK